jgi:hypothetical protein
MAAAGRPATCWLGSETEHDPYQMRIPMTFACFRAIPGNHALRLFRIM